MDEAGRLFTRVLEEAAEDDAYLAFLDLYAHDFDSGRAAATNVLAKNRSIGDRLRGVYALQVLGLVSLGLGRRSNAREALVEALRLLPARPVGAHKLMNRSESPARTLMFSSSQAPAVSVYPDSDKIGVWPGDDENDLIKLSTAVPRSDVEEDGRSC